MVQKTVVNNAYLLTQHIISNGFNNTLRMSHIIITQHVFYYIQFAPEEHSSYLPNFYCIFNKNALRGNSFMTLTQPPPLPGLNLLYCFQELHSWKSSAGLMDKAEECIFILSSTGTNFSLRCIVHTCTHKHSLLGLRPVTGKPKICPASHVLVGGRHRQVPQPSLSLQEEKK